jgi:cytochrome b561
MQLKNSPDKYGAITKTFHWLTSITIICLLGVGLYMVRAEKGPALFQIYGLHKSFGILVLTATFLRVLWHVYSKKPPLVGGMAAWERAAAHAGHIFLYICMLGMPISGWLMSSAFGRSVKPFDLFQLHDLVQPNPELAESLSEIHEYLAYALIGMILLHAAAALKHHFISKDATLKRMLPFGKP